MTEIKCLCGGVQVRLEGEPVAQAFCHCDDCQAMHGAAYVPAALYPAKAVTVTQGTPTMWAFKTTPRATCPECGTRVFAEVASVGIRSVMAGLLPKGSFRPTFHMQCQFAVRPLKDDLPHFKAYPAAMGGSDEKVEW